MHHENRVGMFPCLVVISVARTGTRVDVDWASGPQSATTCFCLLEQSTNKTNNKYNTTTFLTVTYVLDVHTVMGIIFTMLHVIKDTITRCHGRPAASGRMVLTCSSGATLTYLGSSGYRSARVWNSTTQSCWDAAHCSRLGLRF